MVPQNDQAVEMCKMVLDKRGVKTEVRDLAKQIRRVQAPQFEIMNGWKETWNQMPGQGAETDEGGAGHHGGENGLMTEEQMEELDLADGSTAQSRRHDQTSPRRSRHRRGRSRSRSRHERS